jgi:hypothetical protein
MQTHEAQGALLKDFLLESYRYPIGPAGITPSHAHEEYQFCIGDGTPSRYWYRGGWHLVPPGRLSVLMPGEVHMAVETEDRMTTSGYQVLYADADRVRQSCAPGAADPRSSATWYWTAVTSPSASAGCTQRSVIRLLGSGSTLASCRCSPS